jgi:3-dehydroquinate synthase
MDGPLSVLDDQPIPAPDGPIISSVRRTSTYRIHVTEDEDSALQTLAGLIGDRAVAVITDETVDWICAERIAKWLSGAGIAVQKTAIPAGERSKSLPTAIGLLDWLARRETRRRDIVLAVGGGVVIDTAGWVASAYMRGVPYINLPTTLLAQVDAAIGGKVAVDHDIAKNLIGAFYAPQAVVSCIGWLTTLDTRQVRSGLAEVIKMAVICSPQLFGFIERHLEPLLALDEACLRTLVHAASAIKCALVERDPYETDLRRTLNFGHTVGHAVETATGYGPVLHGEAVAYGMAVAVRVALARGVLAPAVAEGIIGLLRAAGLPASPAELPVSPPAGAVIAALAKVRQVRDGSLRFVLPAGLGSALIAEDVSDSEIRAALPGWPAGQAGRDGTAGPRQIQERRAERSGPV